MPGTPIFAPDLLSGRVALVTGGGTNLGRAAAEELAGAGAHVVIAGRREDVLQETAAAIGCDWVSGDIRDPAQARAIIDGAVAAGGRLDILVNNAGGQYFVPADNLSAKGWGAVQRLNVGGTLTMMEAAAEHGFGPEGGTMINVTVSPHRGMPAMSHTGAARAAVEQIGREAAARWKDRGIRVVAIAVGRFATESLKKYPAVMQRDMGYWIPLQRLGDVQEFGWAVTMIASPLSRALSGSVVTIDGGLDNWDGPWPNERVTEEDGSVPTEERVKRT